MTKIIFISAVTAAMVTTASADFSFGDMFKDMKEAAISMSKDAKDSVVSMKDGMVETTKSSERTVTNLSSDAKDVSVKVSDDLKTVEVVTSKDTRETVVASAKDSKDAMSDTTKEMRTTLTTLSTDITSTAKSASTNMTDSIKSVSNEAGKINFSVVIKNVGGSVSIVRITTNLTVTSSTEIVSWENNSTYIFQWEYIKGVSRHQSGLMISYTDSNGKHGSLNYNIMVDSKGEIPPQIIKC